MNKIKYCLFFILSSGFLIGAEAQKKDPNAYALMTARDLRNNEVSNITITNHTGQAVSTSGLFIASFDINDCSTCFGSIVSGDNLGGVVVSPVSFQANQSLPIG